MLTNVDLNTKILDFFGRFVYQVRFTDIIVLKNFTNPGASEIFNFHIRHNKINRPLGRLYTGNQIAAIWLQATRLPV
jgi:hypothetical protein